MRRLMHIFLGLVATMLYTACGSESEETTDSDTVLSTDTGSDADTTSDYVDSTDPPNDSETGSGSSTEAEENKSACAAVVFNEVVFAIPESAVCGYSMFFDNFINEVTVTAENEHTFTITNQHGNNEANCEKSDCIFLCRSLVLGEIDVDGSIEGDTSPAWASISFDVELTGTMNSEGIETVTASLGASCSGPLCDQTDCNTDISLPVE